MKRKAIPLRIKLEAALHLLALDPADVEWDHYPALAMRPINPDTGDTEPPQLDPRYIVPRSKAAHKMKTFGNATPLSGDASQIAKLKRVAEKHEASRRRILAREAGEPVPTPKRRSRAIPSRPFQKRKPS